MIRIWLFILSVACFFISHVTFSGVQCLREGLVLYSNRKVLIGVILSDHALSFISSNHLKKFHK